MPKPKSLIIVNEAVVEDLWTLVEDKNEPIPNSACILPLATFLAQEHSLKARDNVGVWLENDANIAEVADDIIRLPLIAINFPGFMDGRGFSIARLLRERYGYQGEIRAVGHIIRDQLTYLKRCGFTAFCFQDDVDVTAAINSLNDFSEAYQTSVDIPEPLFKRRA